MAQSPGAPLTQTELDDLTDLFENAPAGYLSTMPDGTVTRVNATLARWMGEEKTELVGRKFHDLLTVPGKIFYETHFAPLLRMQGFFNEVALDFAPKEGEPFPALVNATERRDEAGGVQFVRITVFNTTDRRKYERELLNARREAEQANAELRALNANLSSRVEQAVKERLDVEEALAQMQKMEVMGQLTGGIAHDFNNMLSVILAGLNLAERRIVVGDTDVLRFIEAAKDGVDRASALTRRLLAFARRQKLEPVLIAPNDLIEDMSGILTRTLGENIRIETALGSDIPKVFADQSLLENAILNLAVNARDAMPDGGTLILRTQLARFDAADAEKNAVASGDYVLLEVADTGTGMPADVAAKAFEPFFTTKGAGKGTGLGLSQVFGFVRQSNGHVAIDSTPGKGTRVRIHLPCARAQVQGDDASQDRGSPKRGNGERILLVEDDAAVRAAMASALEELGYRAVPVRSGEEALSVLSNDGQFALLLTDLVLPGLDGHQLSQLAHQKDPGLPVLFATAHIHHRVFESGEVDPARNLLRKPATIEEIGWSVQDALTSSNRD